MNYHALKQIEYGCNVHFLEAKDKGAYVFGFEEILFKINLNNSGAYELSYKSDGQSHLKTFKQLSDIYEFIKNEQILKNEKL